MLNLLLPSVWSRRVGLPESELGGNGGGDVLGGCFFRFVGRSSSVGCPAISLLSEAGYRLLHGRQYVCIRGSVPFYFIFSRMFVAPVSGFFTLLEQTTERLLIRIGDICFFFLFSDRGRFGSVPSIRFFVKADEWGCSC